MQACLLLEVLNISASVFKVTMCGKAHREERRRKTLEPDAVLLYEVDDVLFVLAHMDRASHDHRVVTSQADICGLFEVKRLCFDTAASDDLGNMISNPRRLPFGCTVPNHDLGHVAPLSAFSNSNVPPGTSQPQGSKVPRVAPEGPADTLAIDPE